MSSRSWALIFIVALISVAILIACGSSGSSSKLTTTTVTLSDPATCQAPMGPYDHIYVTVLDVQVNTNANASDNDSNWQTVIPDMKGKPQQVDLLGQADNECFLKRLGSSTQLQPGTYQMIRVILAGNTATPSPNACGQNGPSNCVFLHDSQTPQPLLLSSETQTGIKIPASQIAGGKFVVEAGQQKDLNLDFNACASMVMQGNGGVRLKPVLHAGEVPVNSSSIAGKIVDQATQQPITGAKIIVALEYNNAGTEMVKMQTMADSNGNFSFCPVSSLDNASYDVVAVAINPNTNTAYGMTITTGVNPGTVMGNIPLKSAGVPTTISGQVTAAPAVQTGPAAIVTFSALQQVTINSTNLKFIVPLALQAGVTMPLSVDGTQGCSAGTNCNTYSLEVPGIAPLVGAFSQTSPAWTQAASSDYFLTAQATSPTVSGQPYCSQPNQNFGPITITGPSVAGPTINFTVCQ